MKSYENLWNALCSILRSRQEGIVHKIKQSHDNYESNLSYERALRK